MQKAFTLRAELEN